MRHGHRIAVLMVGLAFAAGCAQPPFEIEPEEALFSKGKGNGNGKGGGTTIAPDPGAIFAFSSSVVTTTGTVDAGVVGDGRNADGSGQAAEGFSGAYQTSLCGVSGKIWAEGSGDATMGVDEDYSKRTACKRTPRSATVKLGGAEILVHYVNVNQVVQLAQEVAGSTIDRPLQMMLKSGGSVPCELLRWGGARDNTGGAPIGDEVQVTYVGRVDGARTWTAESTGEHEAGCLNFSSGKYSWDGALHSVPFHMTVTEVP